MSISKSKLRVLQTGAALHALAVMAAGSMALVASAPAHAQDYNQVNATGRVQSTAGQPIAGATVTVTSNGQGFSRTAATNGDGSFRISALPQGSYTFKVDAEGFESFIDAAVTLTQAGAANQFTLTAAGEAATGGEVVVTAGRTQVVDFDRNTTGAVINVGELATRVPVARDITSVVLLAPGTTQGDTAFGNVPSIAGASVSENTYYVNGLNITNFRNGIGAVAVPFDFYQTVEVKTGGISAEFGRTTGGFINATTKSGSNDFHGGITFNWEPDDLRSDPRNTYLADNDSSSADRKEFIAQLSGPIIKDHLFFYGLYNARDVNTAGGATNTASASGTGAGGCASNPSYCLPYPGPSAANLLLSGTGYTRTRNGSPFYGGKLDAIIVDGQRLEATYFNTGTVNVNDVYGTSLFGLAAGRYNPITNETGRYASTTLVRDGGENWVGRYTGLFTNWLTLSAAYGRSYNRATTESSTPGIPQILDQRTGGNVSLANPVANSSTAFDRRIFYRADADIYVNLLGTHHFRGGYDREELSNRSTTLANGNYQITYAFSGVNGNTRVTTPNVTYVTRRYFGNGGRFTTTGEAFYLQDSWTLLQDRLNLVLGVRNDRFTNVNADGDTFFASGDNWAPRLSFSFDPSGDRRTKVYGSFSRYFLPVATNTNVRLAGAELDYVQYYRLDGINADNTPIYGAPIAIGGVGARQCPALAIEPTPGGVANCTINNDGTTPPFRSLVSQNLQSQSQDEYQLGIEQRIGSRWKVGAFYTQRTLRQSLEDAYIDSGVQAYCRRTLSGAELASCLDVFAGDHQYALLNPGEDVTVVLDGEGTTIDGKTVTLKAADIGLPHAKRTYKAVTLTLDREFDGRWSLSANYTISALVGNIEGGVRSDNGQVDSGLTTNFDFPALVNGAYGYLPNHARHNVKIYGSYQLFDWLNVGANLQVTSPRKFGCIGTVPNYVDGGASTNYGAAGFYCNVDAQGNILTTGTTSTNTTGALTPRGSVFQSDWLYNLGLDVALKIPINTFDATLRLSVFNALNTRAARDFQEVGTTALGAPSPNYRLPLTYQTPRFVRLQLGVNF